MEKQHCPHCQKTQSRRSRSTFAVWIEHHLRYWCEARCSWYPDNDSGGDADEATARRRTRRRYDTQARAARFEDHEGEELADVVVMQNEAVHPDVVESEQDSLDAGEAVIPTASDAATGHEENLSADDEHVDVDQGAYGCQERRDSEPTTAELELLRFLTDVTLSGAATDALLALVRRLCSPGCIVATRGLPRTSRALWSRVRPSTRASNMLVDQVAVAGGALSLPFAHFSLRAIIGELLKEQNCMRGATFGPPPTGRGEGRHGQLGAVYGHISTAQWWTQACAEDVPDGSSLLSILLYIDGVAVDFFGAVHMVPIMVTVGNFTRQAQMSASGKRLLGFVPTLTNVEIRSKTRLSSSTVRREIMHSVLSIVLAELRELRSSRFVVHLPQPDGKTKTVRLHPALTFIACDNKEAAALAGVKTGQTSMPCRFCECRLTEMQARFSRVVGQDLPRNVDLRFDKAVWLEMQREKSLHTDVQNAFMEYMDVLGVPSRSSERVFELCPPDTLHTVLGGLVRYTVIWTLEIVKRHGGEALVVSLHSHILALRDGQPTDSIFHFDIPWQGIAHLVSHSPGSRKRTATSNSQQTNLAVVRGAPIPGATKFNTSKWISILLGLSALLSMAAPGHVLPLQDDIGAVNDTVIQANFLVLDLFFRLNAEEFSELALRELETLLIPRALDAVQALFGIRQKALELSASFGGVKLHLLNHFPGLIRQYGAPRNWDTDHWESAHKFFVKNLYRKSSKRVCNIDQNILRTHAFWASIDTELGLLAGNAMEDSTPDVKRAESSGIRHDIRQWRVQGGHGQIAQDASRGDYVEFRFLSAGLPVARNAVATTLASTSDRYHMHNTVHRHLHELINQYLESMPEEEQNPHFMRIEAKTSVQVAGIGNFIGYDAFTINATSHYGHRRKNTGQIRARYDFVEVVIPREAGGRIAGSRELLRLPADPDAAVAQVLAIFSVDFGHRLECLLAVQFLARSPKRRGCTSTNMCAGIAYGVQRPGWLALYPLVCLRRPVLAIEDPWHEGAFTVFTVPFLAREENTTHPDDQTSRANVHARLAEVSGTTRANIGNDSRESWSDDTCSDGSVGSTSDDDNGCSENDC